MEAGEALRRRSGELIAEVERIRRRINELTALAKQSPGEPTDSAITDTWLDAKLPDGPQMGPHF
jgi:hypothetical protein